MFNIFFLVFFAVALAAVAAVFITRTSTPTKESFLLPEEDAERDPEGPQLSLEDLEKVVRHFCTEKNLKIKEKITNSDHELILVAENDDPILFGTFVFGCLQPSGEQNLTPLTAVLEFKDFVKGLGSTKGFLLTTGYFSRDVHQPLEGVKVTLFNRRQVLEQLKALPPQAQ